MTLAESLRHYIKWEQSVAKWKFRYIKVFGNCNNIVKAFSVRNWMQKYLTEDSLLITVEPQSRHRGNIVFFKLWPQLFPNLDLVTIIKRESYGIFYFTVALLHSLGKLFESYHSATLYCCAATTWSFVDTEDLLITLKMASMVTRTRDMP